MRDGLSVAERPATAQGVNPAGWGAAAVSAALSCCLVHETYNTQKLELSAPSTRVISTKTKATADKCFRRSCFVLV